MIFGMWDQPYFYIGPIPVDHIVVTQWALIAILTVLAALATRKIEMVLVLISLSFFPNQKILLRHLPEFMSLYLMVAGLGAIEYLFYGLEECGAFRAYDWAELEEKRRKG